ncbi:hypothetical protein HBI26_069780 [Parastagonospora nodorum]|nr:hypothetical protein HBI06_132440 [Parastagonospora nodorum]KAH4233745.1 hypothetical protein HBI05_162410 [Parastagonospora nodorum]KAH4603769.1 hypothetical protein HBH82_142440 [Parastagonospora nodorum]KAH4701226.1 hypothetical protein HBH78_062730 [Parastagonospora nodorum]KAH4703641.1 hypothetical protein HBH67_116530 [Parastagonospora nodorum]
MAPHPELSPEEAALSPMAIRDLSVAKTIVKRANEAYVQLASAGAKDPNDLKGPGFQALFALIGVGMTLTAIWFFFWAKNGGFKFRGKDDWEDYKSTVLRRKGPDGKTLSNATKSTRLGGGSVVHGGSYGAPESSIGWTEETATNADVNDYRDAEEGKHGLRGGDGRRERKDKKGRRDHTNDYNDPDLGAYRHEKAARVGGLNRQADGMYTDYSGSQPSELGSNVSSAPLVKKSEKNKDPKKEAKAKEMRARERMKKAKAAEKEAKATAAADAKARKEAQKAAIKREKEAYKKNKKTKSEVGSEAPEMAEVTRPLTEYTGPAYTEYTAPSEVGTPEKTQQKPSGRRAPPSAAYSFTTGDDTNTVYSGAYTDATPPRNETKRTTKTERTVPSTIYSNDQESSYYSDYRPNADPTLYASRTADRTSRSASRPRPAGSRSRPTSQSPVKKTRPSSTARPSRSGYAPAPASDIFTMTNGEAQGHMSYPCHIPGLSTAGSVAVSDSVSQAGAKRGGRDVMAGYRRGEIRAVGRRDSLSDSD